LSPLDLSTYTKFGPDRLRFAGLILERLIFRPKRSIQYTEWAKLNGANAVSFVVVKHVLEKVVNFWQVK